MSDDKQAQRQNFERIADAPPTQPQSLPEALTRREVRFEADLLSLVVGEQRVRELCGHFGAASADDLAEADWREFIRLAKKMSDDERAEHLSRERTARAIAAAS